MANLLKFYRGAVAPAAQVGMIWFDVENQVIKVCTAAPEGAEATWEVYGTTPADLASLAARVSTLEGAVKTLNETTLPALEAALKKYADDAVAYEAGLREAADNALAGRLDIIEGEDTVEGSIKKAVADAKTELIGDAETLKTFGAVEDVLTQMSADAKTYSIAKVTEGLVENVKEAYKLVDEDGTQVGETINIYKDSSLISVDLVDVDAEGNAGQYIKYVYVLANGEESTQYVDVSRLLVEAEFKDGLQVSTAGEVSVKVDAASESYLTVGADGVKLSGVTQAITDAVAAEAAIARVAEQANADAIATVASDLAAEVTRATAAEAAIAADLATLDAEVQEHEIVTASALIDLNAKIKGVEDGVVEINEVIKNLDFGVTSVTASTSSAHVTVAPTTAASGEVSLTVDVATVDAAAGNAKGLATDAYVAEQLSPVAATAGSAVQTVASAGETLQVTRDANAVNVELCWMGGSF